MAYDEALGKRVEAVLDGAEGVESKKMFGGLTFMVGGHMCCGIAGDELVLRLGKEGAEAALERKHVREMDFTGRAMKGMVYVGREGLRGDEALAGWVEKARAFVATMPAKKK